MLPCLKHALSILPNASCSLPGLLLGSRSLTHDACLGQLCDSQRASIRTPPFSGFQHPNPVPWYPDRPSCEIELPGSDGHTEIRERDSTSLQICGNQQPKRFHTKERRAQRRQWYYLTRKKACAECPHCGLVREHWQYMCFQNAKCTGDCVPTFNKKYEPEYKSPI